MPHKAIEAFELLRNVSEEFDQNMLSLLAYKLLGNALQRNKEYEKAMVCYKKILQIAWTQSSVQWEIVAY